MEIPANNPALKSWVDVPAHSDFPIQNLPFGIFEQNAERANNQFVDVVVVPGKNNEFAEGNKIELLEEVRQIAWPAVPA